MYGTSLGERRHFSQRNANNNTETQMPDSVYHMKRIPNSHTV